MYGPPSTQSNDSCPSSWQLWSRFCWSLLYSEAITWKSVRVKVYAVYLNELYTSYKSCYNGSHKLKTKWKKKSLEYCFKWVYVQTYICIYIICTISYSYCHHDICWVIIISKLIIWNNVYQFIWTIIYNKIYKYNI